MKREIIWIGILLLCIGIGIGALEISTLDKTTDQLSLLIRGALAGLAFGLSLSIVGFVNRQKKADYSIHAYLNPVLIGRWAGAGAALGGIFTLLASWSTGLAKPSIMSLLAGLLCGFLAILGVTMLIKVFMIKRHS